MEPYKFRLGQIEWEPEQFAAALRAYDTGHAARYSGRFVILPETRYQKLLVEYVTSWCAAELWIYDKDGGSLPTTIDLTSEELAAIRAAPF